MKIKAEDAVARAMDWLAQLREEDGTEPSSDADGKPAADAAPPADAVPPVPVPRAAAEPQPAEPQAAGSLFAAPLAVTPKPAAPLAPLPPVPAAAEPLTPLPPVPVPRAADVPPVAAWASAAWATAAAPAAAVPPASLPGRRTRLRTSVKITERSAIGDELRIPIAWCEMGSCISHHEDPDALGEADIRARAVAEGWRVDALGRLACPKCQQSDVWFWTAHPVAPWDRETAVARTTLMAAVVREHAAFTDATERDRGVIPQARPAVGVSVARGRHREHPGRLPRG